MSAGGWNGQCLEQLSNLSICTLACSCWAEAGRQAWRRFAAGAARRQPRLTTFTGSQGSGGGTSVSSI